MIYFWRIFLWENGAKSTEYTDHTAAPIFLEDKLDETLDTGEIKFEFMPADIKAFPPKTKFRLERYLTEDYTDDPKKWDMVVEHDDVEEYEGEPQICCHRIHLIEASVVAQGMHVDNIALTYELQDVNLNYKTIGDDDTIIGEGVVATPGGYGQAVRLTENIWIPADVNIWDPPTTSVNYFRNSYRYVWDDASLNSIRGLKLNLDASSSHEVEFTVPRLSCQGCYDSGVWSSELFEMNTITTVKRIKLFNGSPVSSDTIVTKTSGATSLPNVNDALFYSDGNSAALRAISDWYWGGDRPPSAGGFNEHWSTHPTLAQASSSYADKTIRFNTDALSIAEIDDGYSYLYEISCVANPVNTSGMIYYYEKTHNGKCTASLNSALQVVQWYESSVTTTQNAVISSSALPCNASFNSLDLSTDATGGPFLVKGVKYSCFDLLRRALLTVDTQILDNSKLGLDSILDADFNEIGIQYPILLHPDWNNRLKSAKVYETIFEVKNLWEVLIQIGYYLHAIPYLEFATDGTDRFLLTFRQLGATKVKNDDSNKITVFNSINLSEYFTQYDAYVTNMYSPQNVVEEWITAKTSDSSYLISNNTSELQTSYPMLEIIEYDITYDGSVGGVAGTKSALQFIFEESIYKVLTSDNPQKVTPAKGNAVYYQLASNKISGLNYVPPQESAGTFPMAMQELCRKLFGAGGDEAFDAGKLKFNSLLFHIKYRTQDSLRFSQIRPDIQNFMKNSAYEKYPHHEQFYGQQDKIVDSERFSANLFGRLVRVGNSVYQRQEQASAGNEKESGDLVYLGSDPYYVISVENEFYSDAILQKVTYSKNFNQLSNIVTIPSEPRFYEVSERSKIRRETRIMDFLELSTVKNAKAANPRFLNNSTWRDFIKRLIFNKDPVTLPNFAYIKFRADYKRNHVGSYGQYIEPEQLFPSSEIDRTDPNNIMPKASSDHSECVVPLQHYPLHDGITFEWDMEDNFKVGDYSDTGITGTGNTENDAYIAQQSHRYVDVMGRADLYTFKFFNKTDWTYGQAQELPKAVFIPNDTDCQMFLPDPYLIGLDKDNREEISGNYQINLLHRASEEGDDFITFPNLFGQKDSPLIMCLLSEPQSMFNENLSITTANVIADNVSYNLIDDALGGIELRITDPGVDLTEVKSIALYQVDEAGGKYAYIVKNVVYLSNTSKLQSWWIYPVYND